MSLDGKVTDDSPVTRVDDLVAELRAGERAGALLVGLEHEKFIYPAQGTAPVPYEGPNGIGALMERFARHGWAEFRETPTSPVIAMQRGKATLSLEPGGQFELSGAPQLTARAAHQENLEHLAELNEHTRALGQRVVFLGHRPFDAVATMPWMPKSRYRVMRETLGKRGPMALEMMLMTATGQVSLDWRSEADCARKVTLTARATPHLVALFANSPLKLGAPSGFLSYRSHIWTGVDAARCGYVPAMLDGSFGYRAYVDWALEAPLLFLRRNGQYLHPAMTFGQLLRDGFDGQPARRADWADHLSTLFPEVRLKRVLEVRGADCVPPALTGALAALMRGLLYDEQALSDGLALLRARPFAAHLELHAAARRDGLEAKDGAGTLADAALELVGIARAGLGRLDPLDAPLLDPLEALARGGKSLGRQVLDWPRDAHTVLDRASRT
ncbi:MAG: glutamate--cysteine ligase [Myxococcaceae bacterium]|nr:glutamate--cysteine ligase [Myxococcaceae bacterium]